MGFYVRFGIGPLRYSAPLTRRVRRTAKQQQEAHNTGWAVGFLLVAAYCIVALIVKGAIAHTATDPPAATSLSVDQQIEAAKQRSLAVPDWTPPPMTDDHRFDKVNEGIAALNAQVRAAERAERAAGQATEGTYVVGADLPANLPAGTYKANPSGNCYWARVRGTSNKGDIIASHYASGPTTVTIAPTDGMFVNRGCGTWTRVS
jgi:hypothetical protein